MQEPMAQRLIAAPPKAELTFCIAEWDASANYTFPDALRLDAFAGLMLAGIIRYPAADPPKTRVVTYWSSSSAHDAQGAEFRKAAGFTNGTTATVGVQGDVRNRKRPRWNNPGFWFGAISAFTGFAVFVIGTLAGFLGDAEKLGQGFVQVSTDPSCVATVQEGKFQILGTGEVFVKEIPWNNQKELETIVELSDPHLDPPTQNVKLRLQDTSLSLSKYEHKSSRIEISATEGGSYTLTLSGTERAAYLWGHSKRLEQMVSLEVFPVREMRKSSIETIDRKTAVLHGEILFGKAAPGGVRCSLWLIGVPEVSFERDGLVYLKNPDDIADITITDSDDSKTQARRTLVAWTTMASEPFTRRPFTLTLKSSVDKTPELWASILKQIDAEPLK